MQKFILKACRQDPAQRYQTMSQALADLNRMAAELGVASQYNEGQKINMTSLFMVYEENQQPAVRQLMKRLRAQARELGIDLKAADFKET